MPPKKKRRLKSQNSESLNTGPLDQSTDAGAAGGPHDDMDVVRQSDAEMAGNQSDTGLGQTPGVNRDSTSSAAGSSRDNSQVMFSPSSSGSRFSADSQRRRSVLVRTSDSSGGSEPIESDEPAAEASVRTRKNYSRSIKFLNSRTIDNTLSAKGQPNLDSLMKTSRALIRFRTNPPHYLLAEANIEPDPDAPQAQGQDRYQFYGGKVSSTYIRSGTSPLQENVTIKTPAEKIPLLRATTASGPLRDGANTDAGKGIMHGGISRLDIKTNRNRNFTTNSESGVRKRLSPGTGQLYNQQLQYKNKQLKILEKSIRNQLPRLSYIKPGVYNDYPCLMVDLSDSFNIINNRQEVAATIPVRKDETSQQKEQREKSNQRIKEETQAAFSQFVMSYYMGLVNRIALENGMKDLQMVQRQSFGFAAPSIADTAGSFRVNLGMMHPDYLKVHLKAISVLDKKLKKFITDDHSAGDFQRDPKNDKLKNYDAYIDKGTGDDRVKLIKKNTNDKVTDWRDFAFSMIETSPFHRTAILNMTRKPWHLNNINKMAFEGKSLGDTLKTSLKKMKLTSKNDGDGKYSLGTEIDTEIVNGRSREKVLTYDTNSIAGIDTTLPGLSYDKDQSEENLRTEFRDLLNSHKTNLTALLDKFPEEQELNHQFSQLIEDLHPDNPSLPYLYDLINDYLVIYAALDLKTHPEAYREPPPARQVQSASQGQSQPPVFADASDSEYINSDTEIEEDDTSSRKKLRRLKVKKVIAHSGMDAIYSALDYEIEKSNKNIYIDKRSVYYEFESNPNFKKYTTPKEGLDRPQTKLLFMDANPAETTAQAIDSGAQSGRVDKWAMLDRIDHHVWVIDTTSSTQDEMQQIVQKFRNNPHAQRLYLVSSGFKNEQWGADKNSYGTVRIITDATDEGTQDIDKFIKDFKQEDTQQEGAQPKAAGNEPQKYRNKIVTVAHAYRRLLKDLGFVPRNNEILRLPSLKQSTDTAAARPASLSAAPSSSSSSSSRTLDYAGTPSLRQPLLLNPEQNSQGNNQSSALPSTSRDDIVDLDDIQTGIMETQ